MQQQQQQHTSNLSSSSSHGSHSSNNNSDILNTNSATFNQQKQQQEQQQQQPQQYQQQEQLEKDRSYNCQETNYFNNTNVPSNLDLNPSSAGGEYFNQTGSTGGSNMNTNNPPTASSTNASMTMDDAGMVFAAAAAAQAMSDSDAAVAAATATPLSDLLVCRICSRDGRERPLLRFYPVHHDPAAAQAAPSVNTFSQDICLHIFCGKTASILPTVNQPDLEILTKAGLKNKHGIGPEVNAALARTRCATLPPPPPPSGARNGKSSHKHNNNNNNKEKHYFLVREFEAHLAAIRCTTIDFRSPVATSAPSPSTMSATKVPSAGSSYPPSSLTPPILAQNPGQTSPSPPSPSFHSQVPSVGFQFPGQEVDLFVQAAADIAANNNDLTLPPVDDEVESNQHHSTTTIPQYHPGGQFLLDQSREREQGDLQQEDDQQSATALQQPSLYDENLELDVISSAIPNHHRGEAVNGNSSTSTSSPTRERNFTGIVAMGASSVLRKHAKKRKLTNAAATSSPDTRATTTTNNEMTLNTKTTKKNGNNRRCKNNKSNNYNKESNSNNHVSSMTTNTTLSALMEEVDEEDIDGNSDNEFAKFAAAAAAAAPSLSYQKQHLSARGVEDDDIIGGVYTQENDDENSRDKGSLQNADESDIDDDYGNGAISPRNDGIGDNGSNVMNGVLGEQNANYDYDDNLNHNQIDVGDEDDDDADGEGGLLRLQDGKVLCGCGGTHLPPDFPQGEQSWKSHLMSKRHQKWMRDRDDVITSIEI